MTALRVSKVKAYRATCERCGHKWTSLAEPKRCASCKTPYWNSKPGTLKRGRPAKEGR